MSAEQGLSADLEHIAQESIQRHVDTIIAVTRQVWESQVDKAKEHSEAKAKYMELARQHEESLQACLRVAQDHEAKARNILIGQLGAEKILPLWEAAGDFAPPGFRQAFQDRVLPPPPDRPVPSRQQAETPESSGLSSLEPEAGPGVGASSGIQHRVKEKRPLTRPDEAGLGSPGRSKRVRRSRVSHASLTQANDQDDSSTFRTIQVWMVDGEHWAFKYPRVGEGYFVLLCNPEPTLAHRFTEDPFSSARAIRHFASKDAKCHKKVEGLPAKLAEVEIVRRFGYQVDEMTEESCRLSNQRIMDEKHVEDERSGNRAHAAKSSTKKTAAARDTTVQHTTGEPPKTRSSLVYGKPEIQEVDRSAGGHSIRHRTGRSAHDDIPRVRSDIV